MSDKKESSVSSPSLADEVFPREAAYHDTDVFGHEEDHDVGFFLLSSGSFLPPNGRLDIAIAWLISLFDNRSTTRLFPGNWLLFS